MTKRVILKLSEFKLHVYVCLHYFCELWKQLKCMMCPYVIVKTFPLLGAWTMSVVFTEHLLEGFWSSETQQEIFTRFQIRCG